MASSVLIRGHNGKRIMSSQEDMALRWVIFTGAMTPDETSSAIRTRLATRLREQLERRGVSIVELARRARTARSFVHAVLDGSKSPSLDWLARVAAALGVDVVDLVRPPRKPKG